MKSVHQWTTVYDIRAFLCWFVYECACDNWRIRELVCRRSCVGWKRRVTRVASTRRVCLKSCLTFGSRWWLPTSCVSWRDRRSSSGSRRCSWRTFIAPTSTTRCRWLHEQRCASSADQPSCYATTPRHAGTSDLSSTTIPVTHDAPRYVRLFTRPVLCPVVGRDAGTAYSHFFREEKRSPVVVC